jgi:hypothetical protein
MEIILRHQSWLHALGGEDRMEVFGDEAGNAKNIVYGSSAWDELYQYGVAVFGVRVTSDKEAIRKMNLMLRHFRFADYLENQRMGPKDQSPTWAEVVTQWRYPSKKRASTSSNDKPVHDLYSHGGDCIKMACWMLEIPQAKTMPTASGNVIRRQHSGTVDPSPTQAKGLWR